MKTAQAKNWGRAVLGVAGVLVTCVACGKSPYVIVETNAFATADMAGEIQAIIDANPHRTIFIPDGVYELSRPITTPADPDLSVSLKLGEFAILRASRNWKCDEAVVRLGATHPANDINRPGSNYSFSGGIIDGAGVANAISIDGGRETHVRDVSIKNARIGIHVKHGANNGSSDADIERVNIVGNGTAGSIGVLCEGHDNTFSKMRIANVQVGMLIKSGGNSLRDVHPLFIFAARTPDEVRGAIGFDDRSGGNTYDYCYSDQFATAFRLGKDVRNIYSNCLAFWYSASGGREVGFSAEGRFTSRVRDVRITFHAGSPRSANRILEVGNPGGDGAICGLVYPLGACDDTTHVPYLGK